LKKASADFKADTVLSGQAIKADLLAGLKSVQISTGVKKDANTLAKALASSLSDVKRFNIRVDISGTLKDYNMQLSSDLDRVLKDAVGKQVKAQAARLEEELKARISEKVNGPLGDLKADLGGLDAMGSELTSRLNLGHDLLKRTEQQGPGGLKLPPGLPKFP
jgi:predicted RecB family endonuclease